MNQILHIFRKDVRHLWLEIAGSLGILVLFVWHTLERWGAGDPEFGISSTIWKVVMVLVPASWSLLLIRSIQDESLVGDRQFWITRPYDWRKLAAEKLLFAVVFVHIPLLVTNVLLLHHAGFADRHSIPGILWIQLLLFLYLDLTTAVVASVTASIVQVLIWIVGIVIYGAGMAMLAEYLPGGNMPTATNAENYASEIIVVACMLGLILFQFVRRTTWVARFVVIGAGLLVALIVTVMPYATDVASDYPRLASGETSPLTIQMLSPVSVKGAARNAEADIGAKTVPVSFPMMAFETQQGTMSTSVGSLVTIEAPNGKRWTSRWRSNFYQFWPGYTSVAWSVEIDRKFFEQFRDTPVKVHLSFAVTGYRESNIHQITAQEGIFSVPGVGKCWNRIDSAFLGGAYWIGCMTPFQQPPLMGWVDTAASTCRPRRSQAPNLHETMYFWSNDDDMHPEIIPISFFSLYFARRNQSNGARWPLGICAGTPFTLAMPETIRQFRSETELDGVKLSDYRAGPGYLERQGSAQGADDE